MDNKEYRKAAIRHFHTCEQLLGCVSKERNVHIKNDLLLNIYYLSGYVIETSLSYSYFRQIRYFGDIEDSPDYKSKGFKTHNFETKVKFIREKNGNLNNIPFVLNKHVDRRMDLLYKNWNPDFRYCASQNVKLNDNINENIIEKYLAEIKCFYETLFKRF